MERFRECLHNGPATKYDSCRRDPRKADLPGWGLPKQTLLIDGTMMEMTSSGVQDWWRELESMPTEVSS